MSWCAWCRCLTVQRKLAISVPVMLELSLKELVRSGGKMRLQWFCHTLTHLLIGSHSSGIAFLQGPWTPGFLMGLSLCSPAFPVGICIFSFSLHTFLYTSFYIYISTEIQFTAERSHGHLQYNFPLKQHSQSVKTRIHPKSKPAPSLSILSTLTPQITTCPNAFHCTFSDVPSSSPQAQWRRPTFST